MSHTHQDDATAQSELTSRRALESESTPAKKKYGPDLEYATAVSTFEDVRYQLGKEMEGRWVGAMPVDKFLDKYVPATEVPLPEMPQNPFEGVPKDGVESTRYDPFISAISGWVPHLRAVNTSTKEDTVNKLRLKTDISIYERVDDVALPDRTDFSRMELWMEFKAKNDGTPFQDPRDDSEEGRLAMIEKGTFTPDTVEGIKARGRLSHYAGAMHSLQFRHFSFSVVIHGDQARFMRWDPSATVVTAAFDYQTNPQLMAEFFWRFDHLSRKERGHDTSIELAKLAREVDGRVREKLGIKDKDEPLYRYEVPGLNGTGYAYGPTPKTQNRSLVSRCTRALPVVWIPVEDGSCGRPGGGDEDQPTGDKGEPWSEERTVYLKDTWRFLSNSPDVKVAPEHEIYELLHQHKTPNIPELVAGGDVEGGLTQAQELRNAPWLCVKPRMSPYQHYRLLLGIVGRPLVKFECTKQLVQGVFDALQAHAHAFDEAKVLHRDVSVGNIILTDEGKGLLIDWELAKMVGEVGSRRPDRTGTWQFMSAYLLQNPGKIHTFTDDLESFLHVLGWTTLCYVPATDSYEPHERSDDMNMFNQHYIRQDSLECGGSLKRVIFRGSSYPSQTGKFRPRTTTPLTGLVRRLSQPFKSLYLADPPTAEERQIVQVRPDGSDEEMYGLWYSINQYDKDILRLESPSWFITTIGKALEGNGWPAGDKAVENLPVDLTRATRRQVQNRTARLRNTFGQTLSSQGPRTSSKRAASPTPAEPSSKRHRGTPAASGTIQS